MTRSQVFTFIGAILVAVGAIGPQLYEIDPRLGAIATAIGVGMAAFNDALGTPKKGRKRVSEDEITTEEN